MIKNIPDLLLYFYCDILEESSALSVKKMFWEWVILVEGKIFVIFSDGEFFVAKNPFINIWKDKQFFYYKKEEKIFMNFFALDEEIWSDRDLMEKIILFLQEK